MAQFENGHIPYNKGKKRPGVGGVKKGNIPWNKGNHRQCNTGRTHFKKGFISWIAGKRGIGGGRHWNWKGDISKIDKLCRQLPEYKKWRADIFQRDGWRCRTCADFGIYVTAHHIKGFNKILQDNNIKSISEALKCSELWDINNGITLCENCHKLTDNYK